MLKEFTKYGVYPWWPENGNDWVHPEDVEIARSIIPSTRVFRREALEEPFLLLQYGDVKLRVRRALWLEISHEGFDMGDWVEVRSRGWKNTPRTGKICEMRFNDETKQIEYQIAENLVVVEEVYLADDLQPVEPPAMEEGLEDHIVPIVNPEEEGYELEDE